MLKKPAIILHIIMLFVLIAMAMGALFTNFFNVLLPGERRWLFALVLLVYAAWRGVRLKRLLNIEKEPEQ
jgi:hypothetical protein